MRRFVVCLVLLATFGCKRSRNHVHDAGVGPAPKSALPLRGDDDRLDSKPDPSDIPATYPPPEYVEKAPAPKAVEAPGLKDVPLSPATGSAEGFRFDAKTIAFDSKPNGWTIAVFGRELRANQAFFPTRAPSFYLSTKGVKIEAGTVLAARLGNGNGLWFQSTNAKGAVQGFAARASYYVQIDTWETKPFDGKWKVAGTASGKILFYVEGHPCGSDSCFRGAKIAGTFVDAKVRYFTAPP